MAHDLGRDGAPRLQLLTIMLLAGGVAFLASVLLLWSPADVFEQMALRYGVAALSGYSALRMPSRRSSWSGSTVRRSSTTRWSSIRAMT